MLKVAIAIRIYVSYHMILADIKMSDGVCETINWCDKKERKQFERYINGYTLFYDERFKKEWDKI